MLSMLSMFKNISPGMIFRGEITPVNIKNTKYNPSDEAHRHFIEEKVNRFKEDYKKLKMTDLMLGIGLGADTFLMRFGGTLGFLLSLVGYAGLFLYATKQAMRQELYAQCQNELKELVEIYHWCAKQHNASISHDEAFLKVLEALSPLVETKELMLLDFDHATPQDISDRFKELLSQSPHKVQFIMVKSNNWFSTKNEPENNSLQSVKKQNKWSGLFAQTLSELERAAYGYQAKEEHQSVVRPA